VLSLIEHVLHAADGDDEQGDSGDVHAGTLRTGIVAQIAQQNHEGYDSGNEG
jgi:hypothetical protein